MAIILAIVREDSEISQLSPYLAKEGHTLLIASELEEIQTKLQQDPDLIIVNANELIRTPDLLQRLHNIRQKKQVAVITLVPESLSATFELSDTRIDDFIFMPYRDPELKARIDRALQRVRREDEKVIRCGDLSINTTNYEVSISGKRVDLTFKEYQLLKFLVLNSGKVLSREILLNKVWGYDYFGGDRTVDVHIRRLRSKIEDSRHLFIETIRSVGYKFKKPAD